MDITAAKPPEPSVSPVSTSPKPVSPNTSFKGSDILKNVGKKLGNMIKNNSSENANIQTTSPSSISEQEDAAVLDSTVQMQREEPNANAVDNTDNATPKPSAIDNNENTADAAKSAEINNENREDDTPKTAAVIPRSNSINKFANVKLFLTRTSTALVEKLKEEFEELDKRIYPEIDPNWIADDEAELSRNVNNECDERDERDEREQLLEYKDRIPPSLPPEDNVTTNGISPKTQDVLADVGVALNERKEKLENMAQKTEELNTNSANFYEAALRIRKQQEQKNNKLWKFW